MERYSIITEKNPREILLLRGSGCKWRRCSFCDYHLDFNKDDSANFALNKAELAKVTGLYGKLEVINSGSFSDLDDNTMKLIQETCAARHISQIHFECHWKDRRNIPQLRRSFAAIGVEVKVKIGVETFDREFRENYLIKGIDEENPAAMAKDFDECCLLFGLKGQTAESMTRDIKTGLENFERVCVNMMVENTTKVKPDKNAIEAFQKNVYPLYADDPRVDILMNNTDFGVGGETHAQ